MTLGRAPHIPVLIDPLIDRVSPVSGTWVDGTFGAGGYTKRLLDAGPDRVIAIDRDPSVQRFVDEIDDERLIFCAGRFSQMEDFVDQADGVVLDLGVSSMQLDQADRGFSFQSEGPLDMRMSDHGPTAADIVNTADEVTLAEVLLLLGEEKASRRIARAILRARDDAPITTTLHLAEVVSSVLPRQKPGQSHPATRSFQALRIAVNQEYRELAEGLMAAERILVPGGLLAVVSFHSTEDRIVKRFFQNKVGGQKGSRHLPEVADVPALFEMLDRKVVTASKDELEANPRSRSAKLRVARRTGVSAQDIDFKSLSVPVLKKEAL